MRGIQSVIIWLDIPGIQADSGWISSTVPVRFGFKLCGWRLR